MSRIDKNIVDHKVENELKNIKKIVSRNSPKGIKSSLFRGCGCCGLILLLLMVCLLALLILFAKTGLITVPVLSRFIYQKPSPFREVEITDYKLIKQEIEQKISEFFAHINQDDTNKNVLYISETQATYLVENYWQEKEAIKEAVVVIEPSFVEFYFILAKMPNSPIILHFFPYNEEDKLKFKILKLSIGELELPVSSGRLFLDYIINNVPGIDWQLANSIKKIELSNQELKLLWDMSYGI